MVMREIDVRKAIAIAQDKGLRPARVKGTEIIQFTRERANAARFEVIEWNNFEHTLESRGLRVYESGGWMKIMATPETRHEEAPRR